MAAKPSDPFEGTYTYIPPSVRQSMEQHMERVMPTHLKKYQKGAVIPQHAERAMAEHMQKNIPGHLEQYVDPYLKQHVINPRTGNTNRPVSSSSPPTPPPAASPVLTTPKQSQNLSAPDQQQPVQTTGPEPDQPDGHGSNPYDFIMNPQKPPRRPLFFTRGSMAQKIAFILGGFILLIVLISIASSFLNSASNAQNDKLLNLVRTESEIVRVADTASSKLTDKDLLFKSASTRLSVESTKQQIIAVLEARGKKFKEKDIIFENPENDAVLSEGEQNGRYDQTYKQLLETLLADYQKLLEDAYSSAGAREKDIMVSANEQINLILGTGQASQQ
jgi:hypothetical protein